MDASGSFKGESAELDAASGKQRRPQSARTGPKEATTPRPGSAIGKSPSSASKRDPKQKANKADGSGPRGMGDALLEAALNPDWYYWSD
jgi:hypothetical protein